MLLNTNAKNFGEYSSTRYSQFSKLLICENCGRTLTKLRYPYNKEYYLTCKNRLKKGHGYKKCDSKVIPYSLLQLATNDIITRIKKEPDVSIGFTMSMLDDFSKNDFVEETKNIEKKIIEIDNAINELVKKQICKESIDDYEINFNMLKEKRKLLVKEEAKIKELAKNNHELQKKMTQIKDFLKNDNTHDVADIEIFIAKILHRLDGSVRFGVKGREFERLSKEEIMDQLKNNKPIYSSYVSGSLGSVSYDMVIIGGK